MPVPEPITIATPMSYELELSIRRGISEGWGTLAEDAMMKEIDRLRSVVTNLENEVVYLKHEVRKPIDLS